MRSKPYLVFGLALVCFSAHRDVLAQKSIAARYEARAAQALAAEPRWATPFITISPRVEQGMRADFVRQTQSSGQKTWNLGNTKGLQLIPSRRVELRFSPPPFILHTDPKVSDGFGDVGFRMKYRLYGSNEEHHNAIVTAIFGASIPTGKNTNGSCCAILSPTLGVGKGYGKFDVISTIGGSLPVTNAATLGRQIIWNSAIQYHPSRYIWVETEFNSTFFKSGRNDGRSQTFATPGIFLSRIPLTHDAAGKPGRLMLTLGVAEQIALTHFNTYNHSPIVTARLRF